MPPKQAKRLPSIQRPCGGIERDIRQGKGRQLGVRLRPRQRLFTAGGIVETDHGGKFKKEARVGRIVGQHQFRLVARPLDGDAPGGLNLLVQRDLPGDASRADGEDRRTAVVAGSGQKVLHPHLKRGCPFVTRRRPFRVTETTMRTVAPQEINTLLGHLVRGQRPALAQRTVVIRGNAKRLLRTRSRKPTEKKLVGIQA